VFIIAPPLSSLLLNRSLTKSVCLFLGYVKSIINGQFGWQFDSFKVFTLWSYYNHVHIFSFLLVTLFHRAVNFPWWGLWPHLFTTPYLGLLPSIDEFAVEACTEVKIHTRHRPVKIIELRPRPVPVKNVQSNSIPVPVPSHSTPSSPRTRIFQLPHCSVPVIMDLFLLISFSIFIIVYNENNHLQY